LLYAAQACFCDLQDEKTKAVPNKSMNNIAFLFIFSRINIYKYSVNKLNAINLIQPPHNIGKNIGLITKPFFSFEYFTLI